MNVAKHTRNTTETLSRKATLALASRVIRPTRSISAIVRLGSSVNKSTTALMTAQAGA
jgi:hypothetical protein